MRTERSFRVHHYARQLGSPFPLLAAVGARTKRIEIGTAVIDMRYENPLYMAEDAGAADVISGGRLQLGISRGSPEQVIDGWRHFGYAPPGRGDRRRHGPPPHRGFSQGARAAKVLPGPIRGRCFRTRRASCALNLTPKACANASGGVRGLSATAEWAAKIGMNLQSSTLVYDETGEPLHIQQAGQIRKFREAWKAAGHTRQPRVSVSRSIFALVDDRDRAYSGATARTKTRSAFLATTGAPFLAAATPPSRMSWSSSLRRMTPSPKPIRSC